MQLRALSNMKWVLTNCVFPKWNASKDLNSVHDHKMKAIMNIENPTTIEELERFIQGNQAVAFTVLE